MSPWTSRSALAAGVAIATLTAGAAAPPKIAPTAGEPIEIRSRTMVVKSQENAAWFEGEVIVQKGDLRLTADRVELKLAPQDAAARAPAADSTFGGRAIRSLHATGRVTVEQGARRATSKEAFYDQARETITLTGEPVAWEDDYRVAGTKMTLYLKDHRSIVEDSRVQIKPADSRSRHGNGAPLLRQDLTPSRRGASPTPPVPATEDGGTAADSRSLRPPVPPVAGPQGAK